MMREQEGTNLSESLKRMKAARDNLLINLDNAQKTLDRFTQALAEVGFVPDDYCPALCRNCDAILSCGADCPLG